MNVDVFDIAALPCDEYWNEDQKEFGLDSILDHGRRVLGGYYSIIGHADLLIDSQFPLWRNDRRAERILVN